MLSTDLQKRFMQLNLNTTELEYSSIYLTHALFWCLPKLGLHMEKKKVLKK